MRRLHSFVLCAVAGLFAGTSVGAQDLAPRAYFVAPIHTNARPGARRGTSRKRMARPGSQPTTSTQNTRVAAGERAAEPVNFTTSLPYGVGNFTGTVAGAEKTAYRSGLLDFSGRIAVNLIGGPAMKIPEFAKWKQKRILGASLKIIAPTGQYDPTKLINWGINRWAFKPELGYSERWGNWVLDTYAGAWFYTQNPASFHIPYPVPQTQAPVGAFEGHFSYDFSNLIGRKMRGWVSLDGNFWWGGIASVFNIPNPSTRQTSSRLGGTVSVPYTKHQSIKVSFSGGTYSRFGGDYQNLQVGWQYTWIGEIW